MDFLSLKFTEHQLNESVTFSLTDKMVLGKQMR